MSLFKREISKNKAIKIAKKLCGKNLQINNILDHIPQNLFIYGVSKDRPVWVLYCDWDSEKDIRYLRSSRIIVISKKSGKLIYEGSANDEG